MSNQGFVQLNLLQTDGKPAIAPDTRVKTSDIITRQNFDTVTISLPPEQRLSVPAFPQSQVLVMDITTKRYRQRSSGFFSVTNGETVSRRLTVFRNPGKWAARFTPYALLPVKFDLFKRILERSPQVRFLRGSSIGLFTDATYDGLATPKGVLAKAALLNLHLKLRLLKDPTENLPSWFDYVEEVLEIDRERMIAKVSPAMIDAVRTIKDNIEDFPEYKRTPVGSHFADYPAGFTVTRSRILTIKTHEDQGNLQLCVAPARDAQGEETTLLDADIDENGKLFAHLADLFKHKVTGGTHPFDIHEFLKLVFGDAEPLGYELI
ncbi:MAG: hypothetical protein WBV94_00085 [Blastocatellia bacterium]